MKEAYMLSSNVSDRRNSIHGTRLQAKQGLGSHYNFVYFALFWGQGKLWLSLPFANINYN